MRNKATRATLTRLIDNARYEVLPTASVEETLLEHVPRDREITVTASPGKGLDATFDLSERLAGHGYAVVPHVAARMVSGRTELAEIADRLTGKGIDRIFVPGGDADPAGDYSDALSMLEDIAAMDLGFAHVGIAGYPESHPTIPDDMTVQAMWDKRRHATHIVSNLTFDPKAVRDWVRRMRGRGVTTPLLLGIPGPVERTKLLAMATRIGVGESTRFLAKNKGIFARLAAPGGFTGQSFLEDCAPYLGEPGANVEGLHVFTFNQIPATEAWRTEQLERLRG